MLRDKFVKFLEKNGVQCSGLDDCKILELISAAIGIELFEPKRYEFQSVRQLANRQELSSVSLEKWKQLQAAPLEFDNNVLTILIADPFQSDAQKEVSIILGGMKVITILGHTNILEELHTYLSRDLSSHDLQLQLEEPSTFSNEQSHAQGPNESQIRPEDVSAPLVVRILDNIFADSIEKKASDIHMIPSAHGLEVKIRVDGILQELLVVPPRLKHPVTSRIKLLCGMDIAEKRKPQDGRLRLKSADNPIDLRISTVPSVHGETVVARLLSSKSTNITLDALGVDSNQLDRIRRNLRGSSKVILASGPTGSGKTSTLYACLSYLADGTRNIITIEDPVEYRIDGITQVQINTKTDVSFAKSLRSALRQDPDVIMVGEIRDPETAQISMQAAQTGHLVLSTIHTNTAEGSITRLLDFGIPAFLISSSISTIIAQRLVRRLAPDGTLSGRVGVFSILEINDHIADAIREGASEREIASIARSNGFQTLWEHGLSLVDTGITTFEELERVLGPKPSSSIEEEKTTHQKLSINNNSKIANSSTRKKVLLVEDDDSARAVLSMLFEEQYFDVIEASNGIEGLEKTFIENPAIIVSDLMMPRMSGLDMVKKIRSDARSSSIPILMLTAASTEESELKLLEHGADDFVSKTADSKILLARVERLLARR
jgi:type II secretory ATPase GspE/PulE/Tfp pilus assembly ATPase PilB-like protein/CheY-like chemotaxis protein